MIESDKKDNLNCSPGSSDPLTGNADITQEIEFFTDDSAKDNRLYTMLAEHWDSDNKCWKEGDYK